MQGKSEVREFLGRDGNEASPKDSLDGDSPASLRDQQVAISGRLASLSRREVRQYIESRGGRLVSSPTQQTQWVVVGNESPLFSVGGSRLGAAECTAHDDVTASNSAGDPTSNEPIADSGAATPAGVLPVALERTRQLKSRGVPIQVISEDDFFASFGLPDAETTTAASNEVRRPPHGSSTTDSPRSGSRPADSSNERLYTISQLSRILEVPTRQIRAWVRAGLIDPVQVHHRLAYFDYRQVAGAKTLSELTRAGVTSTQIRRTLEQVETWLPHADEALSQLQKFEQCGGELLVRLDDGRLVEPSGQLQLDFESPSEAGTLDRDIAGDIASTVVPLAPSPAANPTVQPRRARILPSVRPPVSSEEWFEKGNQLEDLGQLEGAEEAYRNALEISGASAEVYFNLGNVLYGQGETVDAMQALIQAVQLDTQYVEAWNNLGNVLVELGRLHEAVDAYRVAVQVAPRYADAHYNLAETLAQLGNRQEAEQHWRAYLLEDPRSVWAAEVRARLSRSVYES